MSEQNPFVFRTERRLVALTGIRACNLPHLADGLERVGGASIFYHTHHQYLSHHFEKPLFYNDFALWAADALQEDELAEKLAAIDLLAFTSIRDLREETIRRIREYLGRSGRPSRDCPPGEEFQFCRSKSFVFPTGQVAYGVGDFLDKLPMLTNPSLYYHFFEARLRLGRTTNDFSRWLEDMGEAALARSIHLLDPYIRTLDELREDIVKLGDEWRAGGLRA